VIFILDHRIHL